MTARVSVCLPTYDSAAHVGETVRSVLDQTFADFELVVVDDASTDGTLEVLEKFDDPRMEVRRNPSNLGAVANWNRATEDAVGAYVKVLCGDDVLYPDCLAVQVEVLDRHPGVALVAGRRDVVDDDGRVVVRNRGLAGMRGEVAGPEAVRRIARSGTNPLGEPAAVLVRRGALEAAGPFRADLPYVLDVDMWCRVLRHGSLFALDRTVCAFRLATGSWSERLAPHQGAQARAFVRSLRSEAPGALTAADEAAGVVRASGLGAGRRALYGLLALRRAARRVR